MSKYKSKYKTDYERLEMVKAFKASRMSVMEFSRKNNISRETLRGWINAYNNIDGSFVRLNKVIDEPGTLLTNDDVTVKPFVINRKVFMISGSYAGARYTTILFSIIRTAIINHLDVQKYFLYIIENVEKLDVSALNPYYEKLPDYLKIS